ncbi:Polyphosphate:AMP phosphotransferase [Cnuella takakiae]|uniref:Polyphosphate:AMP phosphotransferase n=1 Tax=Cnuella takakiae TaxID=1302690 RepID=A0A1M4WRX0_9BACT|nr:PPK2 family polyphosphate kinase [Cnuella takakiae]OLY91638.1 polyphosphate kinase [Cnuella takakiae]SHE83907.1 Polyphosphate:AMP phosphotransferase [Cnuella takakiae]
MYQLNEIDTLPPESADKETSKVAIKALLQELDELQNLLYASRKHALLVVLQGMDASGKDGLIRDVFGNLNPQGVRVQPFKAPTEEELAHDFLWRIHRHVPERGMIQVFNRSHYEDVLVTRVHGMIDDATAGKRFAAINDFERLLQEHSQTVILKFYLHVSAEEQSKRLKERIQDPRKMWKYNANDEKEASLRTQYMRMYEEVFANCAQPSWHIVPADKNWYKEYYVARAVVEALRALDMKYPLIKQS